MPKTLRQAVKRGLLAAGHYRRRLRRDRFPGVAVLCYHGVRRDGERPIFAELHVTAAELESHCRLLSETCHPISLEHWQSGEPLPDRPVLITFDDGYRSVLTVAQPILERRAIPAVVFASSGPIEQRRLPWYDALARARGQAAVEAIKSLPWSEWRATTDATIAQASIDDPQAPLTADELRQLAASFEIGSHTVDHPILAHAPAEVQHAQIAADKARLEEWTGKAVRAFAYPNGRPGIDYTDETVRLVAGCGFTAAFTTRPGFSTPGEPSLERSRLLMLAGVGPAELAHRLSYSWRR